MNIFNNVFNKTPKKNNIEKLKNLKLQLKKEDERLSIEKEVKCDDGVVRIYNGFMFGIIKDKADEGNNGYLNVDEIIADGYVRPELKKYINWDLKIHAEKWFCEKGIKLNADEIISKNELFFKLQRKYDSIYSSVSLLSDGEVKRNNLYIANESKGGRLTQSLICINDFFFSENQMKPRGIPQVLFSGKIGGIGRVKDGVLIEEKIKDSKKESQ